MSASNCSSSKKRCREEDKEEAEMETFFALVRNIRDTRNRWMSLRSGGDVSKSKRGKIITAKEESRVWKPTFQLEDFADEQGPRTASQTKNCDKEKNAEKGIDLSLSL